MVVVGKIKLPTLQPARTLSEGEYVNAPWLMVCSLKEMVTAFVKQAGQGDARSIMEDVGMKPEMDMHTLLVRIGKIKSASVLQGLEVMESTVVKISMNVRRRKLVNALNVAAKIRGEVTSVVAVEGTCCISETMMLV